MKTALILTALLVSSTTFASEKTCNLLLAVGPNYSWVDQGQLPQNYPALLEKHLTKKGYTVVKKMKVGTYAWDSTIHEEASKRDANAIVFRPAFLHIRFPGDRSTEYLARMAVELRDFQGNGAGVEVEYSSKATSSLALAYLGSNAVFNAIKNAIPKCGEL